MKTPRPMLLVRILNVVFDNAVSERRHAGLNTSMYGVSVGDENGINITNHGALSTKLPKRSMFKQQLKVMVADGVMGNQYQFLCHSRHPDAVIYFMIIIEQGRHFAQNESREILRHY